MMRVAAGHRARALAIAWALILAVCVVPAQAGDTRRALLVSDIHFDPFTRGSHARRLAAAPVDTWNAILAPAMRGSLSRRGRDPNAALLRSSLDAVSRQAARADLLIVPGDLITHRFESQAARALGAGETSGPVRSFALDTARYVLQELRTAAQGRRVVVALGNNDSECGDYRLAPNGPFLAGLRGTVRALSGPEFLAPDFDSTFAAGGYYRMRHPAAEGVDIVVINDVLWSAEYRDRCGSHGAESAAAMLEWLGRTLADIRAAGRQAWLVHHIPVGIDGYSSLHRKAPSCSARVTAFLKEPYGSSFDRLVRDYGASIALMISGHIHHDTYRVVRSGQDVAAIDKVAPGISPVYGNNPGFQILSFNPAGQPRDIETWSLPLGASGKGQPAWRREYTFSGAYGQPDFSKQSAAALADDLLSSDPSAKTVQRTFRKAYPVGHGAVDRASFRAHACAVSAIEASAYAACACRE